MKNNAIAFALILMLIVTLVPASAIAHPGRTDANGGHTCKTNCSKWGLTDGEYHYHNKDGSIEKKDDSKADSSTSNKLIMPKLQKAGTLQVYYLDVGQGDSTLIRTPSGQYILIDAGNNDMGDTVVSYLKHLGVTTLEAVIATHPDADHIGGLDVVINAFKVNNVYAPKVSHTTQTYKDFLTAVKNKKLTIKTAKAGVDLNLKGVTAKFVAPVGSYKNDLNDWSAVLHLTYKANSFLFTGDAESLSEADMLKNSKLLKANVLKVGHHGSDTSSSAKFLKAVQPTYAVISVGKNSYGHPTQALLNRLKTAKSKVYRTDNKGTITAISDGKNITFTTAR